MGHSDDNRDAIAQISQLMAANGRLWAVGKEIPGPYDFQPEMRREDAQLLNKYGISGIELHKIANHDYEGNLESARPHVAPMLREIEVYLNTTAESFVLFYSNRALRRARDWFTSRKVKNVLSVSQSANEWATWKEVTGENHRGLPLLFLSPMDDDEEIAFAKLSGIPEEQLVLDDAMKGEYLNPTPPVRDTAGRPW